jgi:ABC-type antimicrobial peptide transport system permease subunit
MEYNLKGNEPIAPRYGMLKVLTILTLIGSGIAILSGIVQYLTAAKSLAAMQQMANSPDFDKMPDFAKKFYSPEAIELVRLSVVNKLPILVVTLIGVIICILGAINIRKLKMQGYYMWIIGEIFPVITSII